MISTDEIHVYKTFVDSKMKDYIISESKYSVLFIGKEYTFKIQKKASSLFGLYTLEELYENAIAEYNRGMFFSPDIYLGVFSIYSDEGFLYNFAIKERTMSSENLLANNYNNISEYDVNALLDTILCYFSKSIEYHSEGHNKYSEMILISNYRLLHLLDLFEKEDESGDKRVIMRFWDYLDKWTIANTKSFSLRERNGYVRRLHGDMSFDNLFWEIDEKHNHRIAIIDPCVIHEDLYVVDILSELATIAGELLIYKKNNLFSYYISLLKGEDIISYSDDLFVYHIVRQLLIRTTVNYLVFDHKYSLYLEVLRNDNFVKKFFHPLSN